MARPVSLTLVLVSAILSVATAADGRSAGSLDLRMTFGVLSDGGTCPPTVPQDGTQCFARKGQAVVSGLGPVSDTYLWVFRIGAPTCPAGLAKPLDATGGRFVIAGRGEVTFNLAETTKCVEIEPVRNEPQQFTITGGTGSFAGASGNGMVERSITAGEGTETWTGTLVAPGYTFDVAPPKLSGAAPKTVRAAKGAKSAKVIYKVSATDDVDGTVPAMCQPRSGTRFKVGKTTVRCEATDSSANTAKASFTVTVKRR
jgi:hypothetical protein